MTNTTEATVKRDVRRTPRWTRMVVGSTSAMTFTLAQMAPMVLITAAFLLRSGELAGAEWGGIPVVLHLAATSVIVPLAAQAFAGPVYIALGDIPRRHHTAIAARCVRVLPRSIQMGAPVSVLLALIVGSAMALSPTEFLAFLAYLALNVAFAVSLTFAYVVSAAPIVILGWGVFAIALAVAPTVWWLPAAAATVVCAVAVSSVARVHGRDDAPMPTLRASVAASARGIATALPLWGLPLMVFIDDPRGTSMAALFLAILPAVLLYQIYFSLVARPLWGEIDSFRRGLEGADPASLGALTAPIRRSIRRGEAVLLSGIAVGGAVMFVVTTSGMMAQPLVMPLFAASIAGTVFIAEATRLSMVSSNRASIVGGITLAGAYLAAWPLLGVETALWLVAAAGLLAAAGVAVRNAQCWSQLEYRLFWRQAASA